MRAARFIAAVVLWPFVHIADRWHGVDPPARFRDGLEWARAGERRD